VDRDGHQRQRHDDARQGVGDVGGALVRTLSGPGRARASQATGSARTMVIAAPARLARSTERGGDEQIEAKRRRATDPQPVDQHPERQPDRQHDQQRQPDQGDCIITPSRPGLAAARAGPDPA